MSETVYHYCSVETLKHILKNRTIRLSDLLKSNDREEVKFLFDEYKNYFQQKNGFGINVSFDFFVKQQINNTRYLGACFSQDPDSLHMWNYYGNEGVAIGFYYEKLKQLANHINYDPGSQLQDYPNFANLGKIRKIRYIDEENHKSFSYLYSDCLFPKPESSYFNELQKLFKESPFIKRKSYDQEKEIRLAVVLTVDSLNANSLVVTDENGKTIARAAFSYFANRYFDHVMACDIPFEDSLIASIAIGPNCKMSKKDIEELILINNFNSNVEIRLSQITV